jgi:hypothetical protein
MPEFGLAMRATGYGIDSGGPSVGATETMGGGVGVHGFLLDWIRGRCVR